MATTMFVEKDHRLFIRHIVADTAATVAVVEKVDGGSTLLTFEINSLVVVEDLHENGLTAKHLRFARPIRLGVGDLHSEVKVWPRLRAALHHAGREPIRVPGGLKYALAYRDEMIVADYAMSGSGGWIIRRKEIESLFKTLPPVRDSGEIRKFWVQHEPYENRAGLPDTSPYIPHEGQMDWWGRGQGVWIFYDAGSLRVVKIVNSDGESVTEAPAYVTGYDFNVEYYATAEVGKRLPGGRKFAESLPAMAA